MVKAVAETTYDEEIERKLMEVCSLKPVPRTSPPCRGSHDFHTVLAERSNSELCPKSHWPQEEEEDDEDVLMDDLKLVIIEGGPLGNHHHDADTPKATGSSKGRVVRDIAAKLIRQFHNSNSWSTSSSSEQDAHAKKTKKKRIILIGEDGDERDVLVFDRQLDISST